MLCSGRLAAVTLLRASHFIFSGAFLMTARSIRRALERKQKKLARKADQWNSPATPAAMASSVSAAPVGVCFDSVDDRESIDPIPAASPNAVQTGLTGRTVLLSTRDAADYKSHLAAFRDEYQPVGLRECELVQSIADTFWRLARIPSIEMAIFAKGRIEFASLFDEHALAARPHLIDAHTFLVYEKQIRNLQLQEARLVRRREKEAAELRKLQAEQMQKAELIQKKDYRPAQAANGFEFSTPEFQSFTLPAPAAPQPAFSDSHAQRTTHQAA
jgi:hypothetical protein